MSIFLIQGFFLSQHSQLGLGMGSHGEGVVATIESGLCRFMYAGIIYSEKFNKFAGQMTDQLGKSVLNRILISAEELKFTKEYTHRDDPIEYNYIKQSGLWVGRYSGKEVGKGNTKCILTQVSEDIFH